MNLGKLDVVKQEVARMNILGITELIWMGMGEFNSDDHYIYYCGLESLRRKGVVLIVNKRVQNAVLGCNLKKQQNDLFVSKVAAATAKSLQLCPTLCDPVDGSPPDSTVPGILQARILEWVAISFSNA